MLNRGLKMTFNYRFGKMGVDAPKKKTRSVKNDDVEDGGNEQGGGIRARGQSESTGAWC